MGMVNDHAHLEACHWSFIYSSFLYVSQDICDTYANESKAIKLTKSSAPSQLQPVTSHPGLTLPQQTKNEMSPNIQTTPE